MNKRFARIMVIFILALFFIPQGVMARNIKQTVTVDIRPLHTDQYKKFFNVVDAGNSFISSKAVWDELNVNGRIVDQGIVPNPLRVLTFDNNSGVGSVSAYEMKYLSSDDILSGASESYIRLPVAVNISSFSMNTHMFIKIYQIDDPNPTVSWKDAYNLGIETYGSVTTYFAEEGNLSDFDNILIENYTYPSNITNLSLSIFYLHYRGPILPQYSYAVLQEIEVPSFTGYPFYLLSTYENKSSYYYARGQGRYTPAAQELGILTHVGMTAGVYSYNIPQSKSYVVARNVSYTIPSQNGAGTKKFNITLIFPVYSSASTSLTMRLYLLFYYQSGNTYSNITYEKTFSLNAGISNLFYNATTKVPWWITGGNTANIYRIVLQLYSGSGSDIYLYGMQSPNQIVYYNTTTDPLLSSNATNETKQNLPFFLPKYYYQTNMLYFFFYSPDSEMVINSFNFTGINRPEIIVHKKYVYDLLDLPIFLYKVYWGGDTRMLYFYTFGKVDLRCFFTNQFILNVANKTRYFIDEFINWASTSPIGLFVRMTISFLINSAAYFGNLLLQGILFVLNIAAYVFFIWPWIVLSYGIILLQEKGVDAMLDWYRSFTDRITSLMSKFAGVVRK